ncbi:hypothetical protein CEP54_016162 [Fusarium duplospermum]|uniref:Mitochondrial presequence protease n=1 Tax=Fusarium duplospermum TaxID=1325734 RepID=A0A428NHP5_9HYPO|nr:hypothetical protein CEP54_016162 [Fusarium duplospermum]
MPAETCKSNFRKIQSFKTDYAPCTITQYVSERSGMQVVVADRKGPKIKGYFTLATEIFDDSGAPHTLEHLIFMGSKNYQYNGLLDKLSSRAYSSTNAWTATDHTVYTLETAGWQGFSQILPVYLEHVILPTTTDEGIVTEVWHIGGEGNDAGVVYSEMQAVQFRSSEIMDLEARRLLYPENVGFRYETGGMTDALRALAPERIRQFHRNMYQPRNLCLVIVGEVDQDNMLKILDEFEESIKDDIPPLDTPFKRPWIDSAQPPKINESQIITADFPEEDESVGEILNLNEYDTLEKWTDQEWRDFISKWIADAPHVSILGKPSAELALKMKKDEEERIAKRKEELGTEGLAKLAKRLEDVKKKNDEPIPAEVIDRWSVPGTESIHFIESDTARAGRARSIGLGSGPAQKLIDGTPQGNLPLFIQFEDVPTNFVHIIVHIGSSQIPNELKPLMPIFSDTLFNTHITPDGKRVDYEQVVMELEWDTISYSLSSARYLSDPDGIMIQFQVEPEKYAAAAEWIRTMMFDTIFDPQRLSAAVAKTLGDVPESKRDGKSIANEVSASFHSEKTTLAVSQRVLVRAVYLKRLKKLLEKEPEKVVGWFNTVRDSLFTFNNLRFLVTANLATLPNPLSTWDTLSKSLTATEEMIPIPKPVSLRSAEGRNPGSVGAVIVPMGTLETSYSVSTAKGLESLTDPRLAAIMVAIGYLEAPQGTLWNAVRGAGYAYGSYFSRDIDSGLISYFVYRSPDAYKAISASLEAIRKIADGKVEIDRHLLEGTISQIVVRFANEQSTMPSAAQQNFVQGVVRGLPKDWDKEVLRRVRAVTNDEIKAVMREIILPCFEPGKSNIVVTAAKIMQESMETAFQGMGYKVKTHELSYFHDDYGLKPEDGEEDESEEEDELTDS